MSEIKKKRREGKRRKRNNWIPLKYPSYFQPHYYEHPIISPYGYNLSAYNPYLYSNPMVPVVQPVTSCGCITCDLPPVGGHLKGGLSGVCMGNANKCRPGDDRCWCHDTCDPLINPHGSGWWNCSNSSTGGQGVPSHSTCSRIPGILKKY
jgi:hypothetical protein